MNIYLDESYNLQKKNGKMFISINGFFVLNDKILRKKWKKIRKEFCWKRRIHATDSYFDSLRIKSLKLIKRHDLTILTVFQLIQELPAKKYYTEQKINYEKIYSNLLKSLFNKLSLSEYKQVRIIIDARSHKGGCLGRKIFINDIILFLKNNYPKTIFAYKPTPSYQDILIELADFISNTFYKAYQQDDEKIFAELSLKLIKIKNPH